MRVRVPPAAPHVTVAQLVEALGSGPRSASSSLAGDTDLENSWALCDHSESTRRDLERYEEGAVIAIFFLRYLINLKLCVLLRSQAYR